MGGTGILFEEPNPTGSRPSDLIGLYTKWQRAKRPFIREGNRAPVAKATHARYRGEGPPVGPRVRR